MKYCSKCKKVYPEGVECECTKEKQYSWDKPISMTDLDCEAKCECGSTEDLTYHALYKFISCDHVTPSYCRCTVCQEKLDNERERQDSMKYLVIDSYRDENEFCDDNEAVEKYLEYYTEDSEWDSGSLKDVLILKLEPITENLKESDFKPVFENRNPDTGKYNREPNTHIVFLDGEVFRVEDVIVPELEYDGDRTINW